MHFSTVFVSLLAAVASAQSYGGRPCGFKIAPCPEGQVCRKNDPKCDRGENCAGTCVPVKPVPTLKPTATITRAPRPTYKPCGGFRIDPTMQCADDEICMDDPYVEGCGLACDRPGICVKPEFCGGFAGFSCKDPRKICVDDPRDDCDPLNGGADCGGVCV